jgi:two-component system, NtrC family, response regulator HydG
MSVFSKIILSTERAAGAFPGNFHFNRWRVRQKLLAGLIPPVVVILILTGYVTYWFSNQFLNEAIERIVHIQSVGIAHGIENFLQQCRQDLLWLARLPIDHESFAHFQQMHIATRGFGYREVGFIDKSGSGHLFLTAADGDVRRLSVADPRALAPDLLSAMDTLGHLQADETWLTGIHEAPQRLSQGGLMEPDQAVLRLMTPCFAANQVFIGFVVLGIDLKRLRDLLTLYNSPQSPIFAFVRSPEVRYSYFFNSEGWVLFQSEESDDLAQVLSTAKVQAVFSGMTGAPARPLIFRPDKENQDYWQMVRSISGGRHGVLCLRDPQRHGSWIDRYYLGFAPVWFTSGAQRAPILVGGVAFADRSRLTVWAGYRQIDVMFVITLGTIILISFLIFALGRSLTRPILELAAAVVRVDPQGTPAPIVLPDRDQETSLLKRAINALIVTLTSQMEALRIKDEMLYAESQREKARLQEEVMALRQSLQTQQISELVGVGPAIETLKSEILKAAQVDVDVLVIGETGTGKQLTAEAIHRHSRRSIHPFISINCGALDENLLLDSLFGHVKGAFSEARGDRKGAFLAAHGGTLFLDEIGTASPKVQQALLRAIAMRQFRPLGSDQEVVADVRVIAASNEDLRELVGKGRFREDLYYRLAVIVIRTPALRDQPETIALLVDHFLTAACRQMQRTDLGISKAALEKLKQHLWPGNVRELKNCLTRAVAMAEGRLIHDEDFQFGDKQGLRASPMPHAALPANGQGDTGAWPGNGQGFWAGLNPRQKRVLALVREKGEVTRAEYQQMVGSRLPARTALNDLQDLVKKGVLVKAGRGPSTRYQFAQLPESAK